VWETGWCSTVIEAPGVVERIEDGFAWVRLTEIQGGCGRCHEPGGCGGARIAHAFGKTNELFRVATAEPVDVGQRVNLMVGDGVALTAALTGYGLPTLMVLAGVAIGTWSGGDAGALFGLVVSVAGAIFAVRRVSQRRAWRNRLSVSMRPATACSHQE